MNIEKLYKIIDPLDNESKDSDNWWILIVDGKFEGLTYFYEYVKIDEDKESDILRVISEYKITSTKTEISDDDESELNTLISQIAWDIIIREHDNLKSKKD